MGKPPQPTRKPAAEAKSTIAPVAVFEVATAFDAVEATVHGPLPTASKRHPMFAIIGRVVAEWSHFEHTLDVIIWDLARHDPPVLACITAQIHGVAGRYAAIMALAAHRGAPERVLKKIRGQGGDAGKIGEFRNRFVHDAWFVERTTKVAGRFRKASKKEPGFGISAQDLKAVDVFVREVREAVLKAQRLHADIRGEQVP